MSNLVKQWHLKFDQSLHLSLMDLNILLFRRINALRKVTEEVQLWKTIKSSKKALTHLEDITTQTLKREQKHQPPAALCDNLQTNNTYSQTQSQH